MKLGLARNQPLDIFKSRDAKSIAISTRKQAERSWIRSRWQDFWSDMNQEISTVSITRTRKNLKYPEMSFSPKTNSSISDMPKVMINHWNWMAEMLKKIRWMEIFKSTKHKSANHTKPALQSSMIKLSFNLSDGVKSRYGIKSQLHQRHRIVAPIAKLQGHLRRC